MEDISLTPETHAQLERDFLSLESASEISRAKTDAVIGGAHLLAGGIVGLNPASILLAAIAAVAVGLSIHHLNRGLALAKEASEPASDVQEIVYEGRMQEPALAR